ncbi:MAG: hypothetical protein Q9170_002470 [Blastenia crenularia]
MGSQSPPSTPSEGEIIESDSSDKATTSLHTLQDNNSLDRLLQFGLRSGLYDHINREVDHDRLIENQEEQSVLEMRIIIMADLEKIVVVSKYAMKIDMTKGRDHTSRMTCTVLMDQTLGPVITSMIDPSANGTKLEVALRIQGLQS